MMVAMAVIVTVVVIVALVLFLESVIQAKLVRCACYDACCHVSPYVEVKIKKFIIAS